MLDNLVPGTQYIFSLRSCTNRNNTNKTCFNCESGSDQLILYTADGEEFMSSHYYGKG